MNMHINSHLSVKKIDSNLFILDRENSMIHSFNATGAVIWDFIQRSAPKEKIIEHLCELYDIGAAQALMDTEAFIASLQEKKLLSVTHE